jgi:hypothetical protein
MIFADVHSSFLFWHDQFKTSDLAQAATFGLVAANTTPLTNDNTDIHTNVTNGKGSRSTAYFEAGQRSGITCTSPIK